MFLISRLFLGLVLFIAGGRKNPWWGLKKSAGLKKSRPGVEKTIPPGSCTYMPGVKKTVRFFSSPGRG